MDPKKFFSLSDKDLVTILESYWLEEISGRHRELSSMQAAEMIRTVKGLIIARMANLKPPFLPGQKVRVLSEPIQSRYGPKVTLAPGSVHTIKMVIFKPDYLKWCLQLEGVGLPDRPATFLADKFSKMRVRSNIHAA